MTWAMMMIFFDKTPKARSMKETIDKPDFIKIKSFRERECQENEETNHEPGANIRKRHI